MVVEQARRRGLLSDDHFSVDGTLIEAWASIKSFRPKDGGDEPPGPGRNSERTFHGEKRSNETHASTTDPDARLYRKGNGQSSRMAFMGHVLMENRNGLLVGACLTRATGTAEREAALALLDAHRPGRRRITLGADKAYDVAAYVEALRARRISCAIERSDQWVASAGVVVNVRSITSAIRSSARVRGRPGRGASDRPSNRSCTKRRRHFPTVCSCTPSSAATALLPTPSAQRRIMRHRSAIERAIRCRRT